VDLYSQRNIVLRFDMRCAPQCPDDQASRYRAAIDMAAWADRNAVDVLGLSEHHITEDGFLSAPLQLAGMMIAATERIRISVSALLVPLHTPLRLAEDIAILDLVSGGRFSATCGLGYRKPEYKAAGASWESRGEVFNEKLGLLCQLLSGELALINGIETSLTPMPKSPLQALLMVGGNSPAAARRAARFGLIFCPAIDDPELERVYRQECEHLSSWGATIFPREPATTFIAEDPEAAWRDIGGYLLYDATAYGAWRHPNRRAYAESFASDLDGLKAEGKYRILTPQQAIEAIKSTGSLHLAPLCGGVPVEFGWQNLRLYEEKVQPFLD
jgi:alkanesulfonate monooxygenase SsuD/methylene tetrahydromethanopterin reductase-like flavin-dependent oxidoreductase (luciferase family)